MGQDNDNQVLKSPFCVLVEAIVQQAMYFDSSDDDRVDSFWAVRALEDLTSTLQELSEEGRVEFAKCLKQLEAEKVAYEESIKPFYTPSHAYQVQFIRDFMQNASLEDIEDDGD